jgi:hypothetical protein
VVLLLDDVRRHGLDERPIGEIARTLGRQSGQLDLPRTGEMVREWVREPAGKVGTKGSAYHLVWGLSNLFFPTFPFSPAYRGFMAELAVRIGNRIKRWGAVVGYR